MRVFFRPLAGLKDLSIAGFSRPLAVLKDFSIAGFARPLAVLKDLSIDTSSRNKKDHIGIYLTSLKNPYVAVRKKKCRVIT